MPRTARVSTEQLWNDYQRLGSTIAVARLHGYKVDATVSTRLRAAGYQLAARKRPARVSTEQLWNDYQRLGTLQAVADHHGYKGVSTIWRRLREAGYTLGRQGAIRYPHLDTNALWAEYQESGSLAQVARRHGISDAGLRQRFKAAGLR